MEFLTKKIHLVDNLLEQKDFNRALKHCTEIVEQYPEEVIGFRRRSRIYSGLGDYKKAIDDRSLAIELDPDNPSDFFFRGQWYLETGFYQGAISDFSSVISIEQMHNKMWYTQTAYFCRSHAYLYCKEYEKAYEDCTKVKNGFRYFFLGRLRTKHDLEREIMPKLDLDGARP